MRRTSNKNTGKDARPEQPLAPGLDLTRKEAKHSAPRGTSRRPWKVMKRRTPPMTPWASTCGRWVPSRF